MLKVLKQEASFGSMISPRNLEIQYVVSWKMGTLHKVSATIWSSQIALGYSRLNFITVIAVLHTTGN